MKISRIFSGKKKKGGRVVRVIKAFIIISSLIILILIVTGAMDETSDYEPVNKTYVSLVEGDVEASNLELDSSSMSGLNLLLINNITTENYVKEYLTLAAKSENNELTSLPINANVSAIIATAVTESGTYPGTPLPLSLLPWDSSTNSVVWNHEYNGIPSEAMTLSKANKYVFNFPLIGGIGPVDPGHTGVGSPGTENSVTPFQLNVYQTSPGSYSESWKSNMSGYKEGKNRVADLTYFPDQLAALSNYFLEAAKNLPSELDGKEYEYSADELVFMYAGIYNPGIGAYRIDMLGGENYGTKEQIDTIAYYLDTYQSIYEKYGNFIADGGAYNTAKSHAYILIALVKDHGWKFSSQYSKYLLNYGEKAWEDIGVKGKTLEQFFNENLGTYYERNVERTSAVVSLERSGKTRLLGDGIMLTKAYHKLYTGKNFYAMMLKYAGVDVDPSNPSTYLGNLKSDEWKPSGDSSWMGTAGLVASDVGPKRTSYLNEAVKWQGSYYSYSRDPSTSLPRMPRKDSSGKWIDDYAGGDLFTYSYGFDCSSLVNWSLQSTLNIKIGSNTREQQNSSLLEYVGGSSVSATIPRGTLKPGDLVFYYADSSGRGDSGHVAFYIGTMNGVDYIYHSPEPGKTVGFTTWNGDYSVYSYKKYFRIKGVD